MAAALAPVPHILLGSFLLLLQSLQSCSTLCNPMDSSPPGPSVPGILQARILEWVAISFSNACRHAKLLQSCPTLYDPTDSSQPGSSVHRILQARILEWVAISFFYSPIKKWHPRLLSLSLSGSLWLLLTTEWGRSDTSWPPRQVVQAPGTSVSVLN